MAVDRRTFVKGALGASGAALLGGMGQAGAAEPRLEASPPPPPAPPAPSATSTALPAPGDSGIEHVIVVMMENRSFDHFLGWLPHADGRQAGLTYPNPRGKATATYHQTQFNGCAFTDPDHSYSGGRLQYNDGKMNGFLSDTGQRLLRRQLLRGQGPSLHEQTGHGVHHVRPLLLLHHGPDLPEPLLPALGADRPPR